MQTLREVPLTQGLSALIDEIDYPLVRMHKWWTHTGLTSGPYAATSVDGQCVLMHRLITCAPKGSDVDHWNENGLDNRRGNLRVCSRSQNKANCGRQLNNTSGYKGVDFHKGRWRARVTMGKVQRHVGYFAVAKDAAVAYDHYAKFLFGEFAQLNFPKEKHASQG